MKKLLLSAIFAILVSFSVQAHASAVTDSVRAAIASGNFDQINTIAANNPNAQSEIALYLLQQAKAQIAKNPELAAQIFAAAGPFVAQIDAKQSSGAASTIAAIVKAAGRGSCNPADGASGGKNPSATIFEAAVGMSGQKNIANASPKLQENVVAAAGAYVDANPTCGTSSLTQTVSLAQTAGTPPVNNVNGAQVPSPE